MYKVASDRRQVVLHRGRPSDWVNGEELLTADEKIRGLKDGWKIIEDRLKIASDSERPALIQQKREQERLLSEAKKAFNIVKEARTGYDEIFVHMAREILPKVQFELVRNASLREHERRKKAAEIVNIHYHGEKNG